MVCGGTGPDLPLVDVKVLFMAIRILWTAMVLGTSFLSRNTGEKSKSFAHGPQENIKTTFRLIHSHKSSPRTSPLDSSSTSPRNCTHTIRGMSSSEATIGSGMVPSLRHAKRTAGIQLKSIPPLLNDVLNKGKPYWDERKHTFGENPRGGHTYSTADLAASALLREVVKSACELFEQEKQVKEVGRVWEDFKKAGGMNTYREARRSQDTNRVFSDWQLMSNKLNETISRIRRCTDEEDHQFSEWGNVWRKALYSAYEVCTTKSNQRGALATMPSFKLPEEMDRWQSAGENTALEVVVDHYKRTQGYLRLSEEGRRAIPFRFRSRWITSARDVYARAIGRNVRMQEILHEDTDRVTKLQHEKNELKELLSEVNTW